MELQDIFSRLLISLEKRFTEVSDNIDDAEGSEGPQGDDGATGATGAQGPQGSQGDQGDQGIQGDQGVPGSGAGTINVDFNFATSSPLNLYAGSIGEKVTRVEVVVEAAFDNPGANLTVGNAGDNSAIMTTSQNKATKANDYAVDKNYRFTIAETVSLFINPAGSIQGSGHVILHFA